MESDDSDSEEDEEEENDQIVFPQEVIAIIDKSVRSIEGATQNIDEIIYDGKKHEIAAKVILDGGLHIVLLLERRQADGYMVISGHKPIWTERKFEEIAIDAKSRKFMRDSKDLYFE